MSLHKITVSASYYSTNSVAIVSEGEEGGEVKCVIPHIIHDNLNYINFRQELHKMVDADFDFIDSLESIEHPEKLEDYAKFLCAMRSVLVFKWDQITDKSHVQDNELKTQTSNNILE